MLAVGKLESMQTSALRRTRRRYCEDGNGEKVAKSLPNGKIFAFRGLHTRVKRPSVILLLASPGISHLAPGESADRVRRQRKLSCLVCQFQMNSLPLAAVRHNQDLLPIRIFKRNVIHTWHLARRLKSFCAPPHSPRKMCNRPILPAVGDLFGL